MRTQKRKGPDMYKGWTQKM